MHRTVTVIMAALLAASCSAGRLTPTRESSFERSVEARQRTEVVTVFPEFRIPAISETGRCLRDSVSVLENAFARSAVRLHPDGSFDHSLETHPQVLHDTIQVPVVLTDTLIQENRARTETLTVEVEKRMGAWQRFIQWTGYTFLVLAVILLAACLLKGRLNGISTIFKNLLKL